MRLLHLQSTRFVQILLLGLLTGFFTQLAYSEPFPSQIQDLGEKINPEDVISWEAHRVEAFDDGSVLVYLRLRSEGEFGLYKKNIEFNSLNLILTNTQAPPLETIVDPITGHDVGVFRNGEFIVAFQGLTPYTQPSLEIFVKYVACTTRICLFPHVFKATIPVAYLSKQESPQNSLALPPPKDNALSSLPAPDSINEEETFEESLAQQIKTGEIGLWMLLLIVFLGGLLTNLTPCVYPMIPITINVLAKQGKHPIVASSFYALGIIVVYTVLGLFASMTGSLFGQYMASAGVNLFFAGIMLVLGFSMLGVGQWYWLQNLGSRLGMGKASLKQAFVMGCGAGFIASPCTGPILATLITFVIANETVAKSTLYLFIYSLGFALPYVFLGSASSTLSKKKVPPSIQIFIKVLFAGIMFTLVLYYLRIPLYSYLSGLSLYWEPIFLGSTILACLALGLLWIFHLKSSKLLLLLAPAILIGVSVFSGSQWLFVQQSQISRTKLHWYYDEEAAFDVASKRGVPILIDFWAEWCEACKKMDVSTFADDRVLEHALIKKWVFLKLDVTENSEANDSFLKRYNVMSLPTLVLISPTKERQKRLEGYVSGAKLVNAMRVFEGG